MPIANCFVKDLLLTPEKLELITSEWADLLQISPEDICLTFIPGILQGGQSYKILVTLYLPSLWPEKSIENLQKSLCTLLCSHFQTNPSEIFIMTSIIQSGHVLENGKTVTW